MDAIGVSTGGNGGPPPPPPPAASVAVAAARAIEDIQPSYAPPAPLAPPAGSGYTKMPLRLPLTDAERQAPYGAGVKPKDKPRKMTASASKALAIEDAKPSRRTIPPTPAPPPPMPAMPPMLALEDAPVRKRQPAAAAAAAETVVAAAPAAPPRPRKRRQPQMEPEAEPDPMEYLTRAPKRTRMTAGRQRALKQDRPATARPRARGEGGQGEVRIVPV